MGERANFAAGRDRRELRSQELQELQNGERANFVAGKETTELRSQELQNS
jgi:hypothetical protein